VEAGWDATLDAFFLRGQQAGVFRIDLAAPALTEIFVALLLRLIDAERHGRVARAGLASVIERAFLRGAGV
jgi:TetR/AcrR family transcriptional repressor of mexCD-oprJ operon